MIIKSANKYAYYHDWIDSRFFIKGEFLLFDNMEVITQNDYRQRKSAQDDGIQSIPGSYGHKFISSSKLRKVKFNLG